MVYLVQYVIEQTFPLNNVLLTTKTRFTVDQKSGCCIWQLYGAISITSLPVKELTGLSVLQIKYPGGPLVNRSTR